MNDSIQMLRYIRESFVGTAFVGVVEICDDAINEFERWQVALREIADAPCMDPEGNAEIARKALAPRGEAGRG